MSSRQKNERCLADFTRGLKRNPGTTPLGLGSHFPRLTAWITHFFSLSLTFQDIEKHQKVAVKNITQNETHNIGYISSNALL